LPFKKLFPYALAACFALVLPLAAAAQTGDSRVRLVSKKFVPIVSAIGEPVIISLASEEDIKASTDDIKASAEDIRALKPLTTTKGGSSLQFHELMGAAIEQRLGARYSWGATGPSAFDCSGFVWSTFQSAGIDFERGSARTLWARFTAPAPEEQYKFGTLVFFSNLAHVGIVADEHGFYHASRHHGVVYSPFNDYWLSRIDGFRKVPVKAPATTD
jgi:cell wall-associated NlpC family hydrolase